MGRVTVKKQKNTSEGKAVAAQALKDDSEVSFKHKVVAAKKNDAEDVASSEDDQESNSEDSSENEAEAASDLSSGDEGSDEDSEEEESDSDLDSDDEIPDLPKKQKNKNSDGSDKFSEAMNALLDSRLKAYDRKDPILARSKRELKKLESDKLELKAKRLLLAEKKARLTSSRVKNLLPTDDSKARQVLEKEKKLKKVAQRGVIKLFNAILTTQTETNKELDGAKVGQTKKQELMSEISKEKFLNLVQEAGLN